MNIEQIAKICHDANKSYCESIGDYSQNSWESADNWQRESAIKGVEFTIAFPNEGPSAQHDAWLREKEKEGWTYGEIKDASKKEHPCMVSYDKLPKEQQIKDYIFRAIVMAFVEVVNS